MTEENWLVSKTFQRTRRMRNVRCARRFAVPQSRNPALGSDAFIRLFVLALCRVPVLSGDINLRNWDGSGTVRSVRIAKLAGKAILYEEKKTGEKTARNKSVPAPGARGNGKVSDSPQSIPCFVSPWGERRQKRNFCLSSFLDGRNHFSSVF